MHRRMVVALARPAHVSYIGRRNEQKMSRYVVRGSVRTVRHSSAHGRFDGELPGGVKWIDIDFSVEHATLLLTTSVRGSDHRPAVIKCPSSRQLMPPESVEASCLDDTERSPRLRTAHTGFLRKKDSLCPDTSLSSVCGRRAMVNKIWCRKVARAWLQAKPDPPHPRAFSEPRCQNYIGAWYLTYRCCVVAAWMAIIVCSIFELGSSKPIGNNHKWPIYLTNWDLLLGAAQASLGLALVWKRWKSQTSLDFDASSMELGKTEKVYWFLYTSTCTIAIGVTVSYWCTVYDPKLHQIDPLNIMLHVCNSLLMIVDLCLMSIPLRLRHFWWCLTIVVTYILFSLVYYSAGGLDKRNLTYIYKVLDWQKPGRTLLVCLGGLIFLVIVHCLLCLATRLRERFYARNVDRYVRESTINSTSEQSRQSVKQIEIV